MWKDFFSFSRREQKGIIILLLIIVILLFIRLLLPLILPKSDNVVVKLDSLYFTKQPDPINKNLSSTSLYSADSKIEISEFDPNVVTVEFLEKIGIKTRIANTWHNYIQRGGIFNSPEDVLKIYGMDSSLLIALLPYMIIKETPKVKNEFKKPEDLSKWYGDSLLISEKQPIPKYIRKNLDFLIEINSADTSELMLLRGIGPVLSRRIVYYRKQLGGFITPLQLLEIEGIRQQVLEDNTDNITVDSTLIVPLNINTASIRQLRDHPYLDFYMAQAIVNKRKINRIEKIDEVFELEPFTNVDKEIMIHYLSVKN